MGKRIILAHKYLHPHHRYQLGVVFLFVLGLVLLFPYALFMTKQGLDQTLYQWYFILPWSILYIMYGLYLRSRVSKEERIRPQKRHLVWWIVLGLALIFYHTQPLNLERLYGVDIIFTIFTLFLADTYWDFKDIPSRS
jgi:peptidoglycan/LPS O-acetylase OafA/YrhL